MPLKAGASLKVPKNQITTSIQNRVADIAMHVPWYGFRTQVRLARDSGVSEAAISRLLNGRSTPSLKLALSLTAALSRRLQRPLALQEVFSLDGTFPTDSACQVCGCRACVPPHAYDADDRLKPEFQKSRPSIPKTNVL